MPKTKKIRVKVRTYEDYLQIFNGVLKLTPKELEVLAVFLRLHIHLKEKGMPSVSPFTTAMKKVVAKRLGWSDFNALNVYIKRLHDKGAIKANDDDYDILKILVPRGEKEVLFRLIQP